MSKATWTFGRFNPPTEAGHGKLVQAVQAHAEKTGGTHYIFPSHSQDAKKNPLSHEDKVHAMNRLFPDANVVSHGKVRTAIDAMKHLEKKGHTHVTMVVGSDRVAEFHGLLNKYRTKEFPGIKKVNVISAGNRDPDAEGAEGMSASKLRGLVSAGKKDEFVSNYSDKKLGNFIHDKVKAGMQMESTSPIGIFLLGGPGSGKDYVLKNIFSRFDLTEVQADQLLSGRADKLIENNQNIVINGVADFNVIQETQSLLEGYNFDYVYVSVTNKVSRLRNEERESPLPENKRIEKWYRGEKLKEELNCFVFNNSINLTESSEMEKVFFASQIEKLLERLVTIGLELKETSEFKTYREPRIQFGKLREQVKAELKSPHTVDQIAAKHKVPVDNIIKALERGKKIEKEHTNDEHVAEIIALAHLWEKPDYYTLLAKVEQVDHVAAEKKMERERRIRDTRVLHHSNRHLHQAAMGEAIRRVPRSGNITAVKDKRSLNDAERAAFEKARNAMATSVVTSKVQEEVWDEPNPKKESKPLSSSKKARAKARAKAAGRPYPNLVDNMWASQLKESQDLDALFEVQLVGTDEYRKHAIAMTPGQGEIEDAFPVKDFSKKSVELAKEESDCGCDGDCGCDEPAGTTSESNIRRSFKQLRESTKKEETVDSTPELKPKKKNVINRAAAYDSTLQGIPVAPRFSAFEEKKPQFMPTPQQVPAPPGGLPVPKGFKRVKDNILGTKLVPVTVKEAVEYHLENKISFTENAFRPGSEMFFEMLKEAKRLYKEGAYEPKDEWEQDLLDSDVGEFAAYEGSMVPLDYPVEEKLNEEDKTDGKGIGKPWREGGGGAVYVRSGDGVKKVRFSQSGMKKKFMDPGATRSFVARHRCLTNKDKTSASYWACRYPRFFSNSGKTWW
jgi:dephospho-CoA kinase